jgi:hypothetical protein
MAAEAMPMAGLSCRVVSCCDALPIVATAAGAFDRVSRVPSAARWFARRSGSIDACALPESQGSFAIAHPS